MQYLVDTNVCIRYLRGDNQRLAERFLRYNSNEIIICSVVRSELYYGAYRSDRINDTLKTLEEFLSLFPDVSFDSTAAKYFGRIRADLFSRGLPIGPYDLQIAAIALSNDYTIVTHNVSEFSRVVGLKFEDWES